jgi:hypothetical protein
MVSGLGCRFDVISSRKKNCEALEQFRRPKVVIYSFGGPFCQDIPRPIEPMRIGGQYFVFLSLVTGYQPMKIGEFLAWNNILPPSKHDQNEEVLIVGSEIIKMARESMMKARDEIRPNCAVSCERDIHYILSHVMVRGDIQETRRGV